MTLAKLPLLDKPDLFAVENLRARTQKLYDTNVESVNIFAKEIENALGRIKNAKAGRCTEKNPCWGECGEEVRGAAVSALELLKAHLEPSLLEMIRIQTSNL